ncbi:TetR/AcrR family transcriptional regulator [Sphingorhabdus sp. EL138]|uniref:TetR/AcrR family transcriptional regulator n=1 Tax=Sphingorhabdus sp. EL138 TaxID=2073156 RepID=UPI0013A5B19A|nr:TetR/AcrR family transcriptional regulator [Sphingorhabdus sp. EL138]
MAAARQTIAKEGFDALKLRDLATSADVTVPTIYNLIGGKPDILNLIIGDLLTKIDEAQANIDTSEVEAAFEAQIDRLAELFATDEDYYRAAFIAGDRSGLFEHDSETGVFAKFVAQPIAICRDAKAKGLLLGEISSEQLGEHIYGSYRLARQDWSNGYFDLPQFRRQSITGVYLCLAADAAPDFRIRLFRKISALQ